MNTIQVESETKARGILRAPTMGDLEFRKYLSREWRFDRVDRSSVLEERECKYPSSEPETYTMDLAETLPRGRPKPRLYGLVRTRQHLR